MEKEVKKNIKDIDEKVEEFMSEFREHGLGCGQKIAEVARLMHPSALLVVPLYRSCIVVEQSEEEAKEGSCTIFAYADPHWRGGEIDIKNLKSEDFHSIYKVLGDRQGAIISLKEKLEEVI